MLAEGWVLALQVTKISAKYIFNGWLNIFLNTAAQPKWLELGQNGKHKLYVPWIIPAFCYESSQRRALKRRRCSGLDAWIVPAFCSGLSPRGALKTGRCSGLDAWIIPAFCSGSSPHIALKTGRCSESAPIFLFSFLTNCYYPQTLGESVSPVCGMLTWFSLIYIFILVFSPILLHCLLWNLLNRQCIRARPKIYHFTAPNAHKCANPHSQGWRKISQAFTEKSERVNQTLSGWAIHIWILVMFPSTTIFQSQCPCVPENCHVCCWSIITLVLPIT